MAIQIPHKFKKQEDVYLKGTFKWIKHLQPDFQWEPAGKWSCQIFLVGEELDKMREWQARGVKNTIKKDEAEGWYSTLSRKCSFESKGKVIARESPRVFQVIDGHETPIMSKVGNGSTGVAKCILWGSPNFPGLNLRWEALRIDSLVPFNVKEDYPDGGAMTEDLKKIPEEALF